MKSDQKEGTLRVITTPELETILKLVFPQFCPESNDMFVIDMSFTITKGVIHTDDETREGRVGDRGRHAPSPDGNKLLLLSIYNRGPNVSVSVLQLSNST